MAKRHYGSVSGPEPVIEYIFNYEKGISSGSNAVVDKTDGNLMAGSANYAYNGNWWYYNVSAYSTNAGKNIGGAFKMFYPNKIGKWDSGQTPNPPTNGISPDYYGGSVRVEALYYTVSYPSSTKDYHQIWGCVKSNNTKHRGCFGLFKNCPVVNGNNGFWSNSIASLTGFYYIELSNHSTVNYADEMVNYISPTINNPYYLRHDLTEAQHRIKIFDVNTGTLVYDTGVRNYQANNCVRNLQTSTTCSRLSQQAFTFLRASIASYHSDFMQ